MIRISILTKGNVAMQVEAQSDKIVLRIGVREVEVDLTLDECRQLQESLCLAAQDLSDAEKAAIIERMKG